MRVQRTRVLLPAVARRSPLTRRPLGSPRNRGQDPMPILPLILWGKHNPLPLLGGRGSASAQDLAADCRSSCSHLRPFCERTGGGGPWEEANESTSSGSGCRRVHRGGACVSRSHRVGG